MYEDRLVGRITTDQYDEYVTQLEAKQQELNDRLKLLTSDNKSFQLTASYLLDLAQRAEQLFKESDEALQNKLLEYVLSNIELKDKKLSYMFNQPFKTIVEAKKMSLAGSESNIWCDNWVKGYTKSLVKSIGGSKYLKYRIKSFCKVVRRGSYMTMHTDWGLPRQSPNDLDLRSC